jgi:methionine synthase I (cobalamin-dependent)
MNKKLLAGAKERIIIFDGAMGTMLMAAQGNPRALEFGKTGCGYGHPQAVF